MPRHSTPPTVTKDGHFDNKYTHPSYGVVNISRVSGDTELFDSAFVHQHFISLSVSKAARYSDGGHDMIHADHGDDREQYIEIWMSETQFARAITSMNMGSGSPCTVNRFNGESIPSPEAEDLQKSHKEMVKEKLEGQLQSLIDIAAPIREKREKKQRLTLADMDRITEELHLAAAHFESNMTYYASTLEEHMEKTVAAAKAEIEVHLMTSAKRLGIPQDEAPPAGAQ